MAEFGVLDPEVVAGDEPYELPEGVGECGLETHGMSLTNASHRGWGPGWPNCQRDKIVKIVSHGITVWVRREIALIMAYGIEQTFVLGYEIRQADTGCFNCRAVTGSTTTPSNHSWALAIDINWGTNGYSASGSTKIPHDMPPAMVALWKSLGFEWGGDWTRPKDYMHFEYAGTPATAARKIADLRLDQPAPVTPDPNQPPPVHAQSTELDLEPLLATLPQIDFRPAADGKTLVRHFLVDNIQGLLVAFQDPRCDPGKVDGLGGLRTLNAVKFGQLVKGLDQDGIVGPDTWRAFITH